MKDMIIENDKTRRANLHMFKAIERTPFSSLKIDNVEVIAGSFQEEDNIAYNTEPTTVEEDQHSISSGDTDHEQEKAGYDEKLKEMKRQREDPMNHCEGDTDIEDLYAPEDDVVDLGTADMDALIGTTCELSDPPSDDGRLSALESEMDEKSKPPPGKRRRGKGVQVQMIYFDESNMTDTSQLCKGMCFTDAGQFRKALKSYHIVKGRDYKFIRNKDGEDQMRGLGCKDQRGTVQLHAQIVEGKDTHIELVENLSELIFNLGQQPLRQENMGLHLRPIKTQMRLISWHQWWQGQCKAPVDYNREGQIELLLRTLLNVSPQICTELLVPQYDKI
ncbi:hypothetical protein E2562_015509 [Oryza meyeriana var. granulata]|uniref:Transposase MuDR plant domain-containing protein n=1 Tax=Oryza meyeriana var. granulata TaxID=110450 RepID=A0A6G1CR30_9ORYZ|nr:hypothetical protein E2562_015509 [Oryza meyeriana var. granulata]